VSLLIPAPCSAPSTKERKDSSPRRFSTFLRPLLRVCWDSFAKTKNLKVTLGNFCSINGRRAGTSRESARRQVRQHEAASASASSWKLFLCLCFQLKYAQTIKRHLEVFHPFLLLWVAGGKLIVFQVQLKSFLWNFIIIASAFHGETASHWAL
jgi:hypothetical protein